MPLCRRGGRLTCLLLRQEKVSKEKATRSLGPCASLRAPCGAQSKRGLVQTRLALRQARALIRLLLRSSAQPGRVGDRARERIRTPMQSRSFFVFYLRSFSAQAQYRIAQAAIKYIAHNTSTIQRSRVASPCKSCAFGLPFFNACATPSPSPPPPLPARPPPAQAQSPGPESATPAPARTPAPRS